jgi:hypothetical protein
MTKHPEFSSRQEFAKVTREYISLLEELERKLETDNVASIKELIEELKKTECWFFPLRQSIFGS